MSIRSYNPATPGRRHGSVLVFKDITDRKKKPEKSPLLPKPKMGGRNNLGVIYMRFRGGTHKRMYRLIDFRRRKNDVWGTVERTGFDPDRSTRTALFKYEYGVKSYILAPQGLKTCGRLLRGNAAEPRID